jgi:Flp pilus assembly protein TadG
MIMLNPASHRPRIRHRGAAVAELAILLPFLALIFVAAVDFGRVFYYHVIVTNSARSGALYGSIDAAHAADTTGIQTAAQAEAPELTSTLNVSSTTGTDGAGNPFVSVTVTYPFTTITNFPGIPGSATVGRTVQMRVMPP